MSNLTITIAAPELAAAVNNLADALRGGAPSAPAVATPSASAPIASTPPAIPKAPVAPTTAPTYTLEQLATAATPLIDAGRQTELTTLLAQFSVQALTQLPKEQYGSFATALRSMGAKI